MLAMEYFVIKWNRPLHRGLWPGYCLVCWTPYRGGGGGAGGGQRVGGWVNCLFQWFLGGMDPPPGGGGFSWVLGLRALGLTGALQILIYLSPNEAPAASDLSAKEGS